MWLVVFFCLFVSTWNTYTATSRDKEAVRHLTQKIQVATQKHGNNFKNIFKEKIKKEFVQAKTANRKYILNEIWKTLTIKNNKEKITIKDGSYKNNSLWFSFNYPQENISQAKKNSNNFQTINYTSESQSSPVYIQVTYTNGIEDFPEIFSDKNTTQEEKNGRKIFTTYNNEFKSTIGTTYQAWFQLGEYIIFIETNKSESVITSIVQSLQFD